MVIIKKLIDNLEEYLGTAFMALMGISVTLGVLSRVFRLSFDWSSDVARYSFMWAVFLGAVVASKRNSHIIIEVFVDMFPQKIRRVTYLLTSLITMAMAAVMAYYGFRLTAELADSKMAMLPYSMGWVYASLPVCCALMFLRILQNLVREFLVGKEEPAE